MYWRKKTKIVKIQNDILISNCTRLQKKEMHKKLAKQT